MKRVTLEEKKKLGLYEYENYYWRVCKICNTEKPTTNIGESFICLECELKKRKNKNEEDCPT